MLRSPVHADEKALWQALVQGHTPHEAAKFLGVKAARVEYLCQKWRLKGRYDWRDCYDLGWIVGDPAVPPWETDIPKDPEPETVAEAVVEARPSLSDIAAAVREVGG